MLQRKPRAHASCTTLALAACLAGCGKPPATSLGTNEGSTNDDASIASDGGFAEDPGDGGGPLQARLTVDGMHAGCGGCATLTAQAQGGRPPYTYAWSVPGLVGPGPHSVCPAAPATYSVVVTDSSGAAAGELQQSAAQVEARGSVDCADTPRDGGFTGCFADSGDTAGTRCETDDAGLYPMWWTTSGPLTATLVPGAPYHVSVHRTLPIAVGAPVTVDVYGADELCKPVDKLFTEVLDGTRWDATYCFTPARSYAFIVNRVMIAGTLVSTDFGQADSLCTGCDEPDE